MKEEEQEQRTNLQFAGDLQPAGGADPRGAFEILAITAGEGNGWKFAETVLQESLGLWDGVETFIDHGSLYPDGHTWAGRSVKDLAGVCSAPAWDASRSGVKLQLKASGPSGPMLEAVAREWLAETGPKPRLGFSADVLFTAKGREVRQILRVMSLDLVFNPARGGAFVRALNQQDPQWGEPPRKGVKEDRPMGEETNSMISGQGVSRTNLTALLTLALEGARLPETAKEQIRARFNGRDFSADEVTQEIERARALVGALQAPGIIQGPGMITGMLTAEERLQAAVDDLFEAPREEHMKSAKVERLSGIRELYVSLTGDTSLTGGYYKDQARFATTATLPNLIKNAMNKIIKDQTDLLGQAGYLWWKPIVRVEHFDNLNQITGTFVSEIGALPSVAEGAEYTELPVADVAEVGSWTKYGGYLPLTMELIDRDNLGKLKNYPRKMATAAIRSLSAAIAGIFTANGGAGPVMADGYTVFHANHANLGATALSSAEWEAACRAVYSQSMLVAAGQAAPKLAIDPRYLLVPRGLRLSAYQLLYPQMERATNIFSQNMQQGQPGDVITIPDWTDASDWAVMCDPTLAPAIYVGERFGLTPEIFVSGDPLSPAMFSNDETRLKVRFFVSVFVADFRPMYKENVP
ncbi:MAG TPA: hypothetical protein VGJ97_11725 [Anaerolineaceae bacterium]|jgi:hypothetical protein